MRASGGIGRVGGLAVALGIGAAVATGVPAIGYAAPGDDSSSSNPGTPADDSATADVPAGTPRSAPRTRRSAPATSDSRRQNRRNDGPPKASAAAAAPSVPGPATPARANAPEPVAPAAAVAPSALTASIPAPATSAPVEPIAVAPVQQIPVARAAASVLPASTIGTLRAVPSPFSASGSGSPAESAMAWTVLAAVRRLGRPESSAAAPSAAVSTGQTLTPRAAATGKSRTWKFRNATPTLSPQVNAQDAAGVITGALNAADADGDPLTYAVSSPAHGTVVLSYGGFTYTPDKVSAHNGVTDQFTVTVSDEGAGRHRHGFGSGNRGHTATSTVTVVVSPVNAAPTATASVGSPNAGTGLVAGQITGTDPDNDPLSYSAPASTAKGTVHVSADGSFTYTPNADARHAAAKLTAADADKTDGFSVTVTDGRGGSVDVPVTVAIAPANSAPTATATVGSPNAGTGAVSGSLSAVDADGDVVSFGAGSVTTDKGSVAVAADGSFVYTPSAPARHAAAKLTATDADKTDSFSITLTDGYGGSTSVPVNVVVSPANSAPTGTAAVTSTNGGTGVVSGSVTAQDGDADPLTYAVSQAAAKGTVSVSANGAFSYTPTAAARHAAAKLTALAGDKADSFTITVSDGHGGTAAVPVSVTIVPANAAPTATASVGAPDAGTGLVAGAVHAADTDGDALTYSAPAATSKGTVHVSADGSFTYTPTADARHAAAKLTATNADKTDGFTVTVTDGYGGSVQVPVTVAIAPANSAPIASATVSGPNAGTGAVSGSVSATDADGDAVSFGAGSYATPKGTVVVASDGSFVYTPSAPARHAAAKLTAGAADKADSFTLTVTDGYGGSASVPVKVVVSPANSAPTGTVSITGTNGDTGVVSGAVIGSDADGDPITYTGSTTTTKGTVVVAANGGFTYTPTDTARQNATNPNASAADKSDSFTVTLTDGYGGSTAVSVKVSVVGFNTPPVASATVGSPNPTSGVVSGSVSASDVNGDPLTYTVSKAAAKGTVSVSANGAFTYTPTATARHAAAKINAPAADKTDTFTITVSDGRGGTASVAVNVTVAPANAAPTGTTSVGVPDATTGVLAGAVLGVDADGDTLTYSGPASTSKGTISLSPTGSFTYTPTALARHIAGLTGADLAATTDTFTVTVTDGYGGSVTVPVTVSISPAAVNFVFVYSGTGWTDAAKSAMQKAAARLSAYLIVDAPVTITYSASGQNQPSSGFLASNYTNFSSSSPGFYGTVVQTEILTGVDSNGSAVDSQISWNFAYPWALGDTVPNNQYDFQAVAMHEMMHSLGMLSGVGNPNSLGTNWTVYDSYLSTANGTKVIGQNYVWNPAYVANLTGGNGGLFFAGPHAMAAYGGPVPVYDPSTWASGSSVSHLDPAFAPAGTTYLMDPADGYGPGVRALTPVEIGILQDLGYTVYQPASVFFFVGFGFLRRRRSFARTIAPEGR